MRIIAYLFRHDAPKFSNCQNPNKAANSIAILIKIRIISFVVNVFFLFSRINSMVFLCTVFCCAINKSIKVEHTKWSRVSALTAALRVMCKYFGVVKLNVRVCVCVRGECASAASLPRIASSVSFARMQMCGHFASPPITLFALVNTTRSSRMMCLEMFVKTNTLIHRIGYWHPNGASVAWINHFVYFLSNVFQWFFSLTKWNSIGCST